MTNLRKAAEMALDALHNIDQSNNGDAIEALRQALAQPEQEPVVGMFEEKLPDQNPPPWSRSYRLKRDWVGLTDEDKDELLNLDNWTDIVEAVEAKLKEKNGG